jgi:NADPH:quinone reductase-like Zn-dependent oxidoreductase
MRAFVIKELSHPSKILLTTDAPEPIPTTDQVIVEVYSAGLNFYDVGSLHLPKQSSLSHGFNPDSPGSRKISSPPTAPLHTRQ